MKFKYFLVTILGLAFLTTGCAEIVVRQTRSHTRSTRYGDWKWRESLTGYSLEFRSVNTKIRDDGRGNFVWDLTIEAAAKQEFTYYRWRKRFVGNAWDGWARKGDEVDMSTLRHKTLPAAENTIELRLTNKHPNMELVKVGTEGDYTLYRGHTVITAQRPGWTAKQISPRDSFHSVQDKQLAFDVRFAFKKELYRLEGQRLHKDFRSFEESASESIQIYKEFIEEYKVRALVNQEINSRIKHLTIDVLDRNSHAQLKTQLNVSVDTSATKYSLVDEVFSGKTTDPEVFGMARRYVGSYLEGKSSKWGSHFEFSILAPSTVKVESINKAYHYVSGSFKVTENTNKAIFLTDIGQKLRVEQTKEGEGGFIVDND